MQFKKEGFPSVSEIVICTVKKILHNSVFVVLDEYKDREGIIHISEIAPGRIRSIREYVREGRKVVCSILRVYQERNHIELSLRRVTTSMRIKKNEELKMEQKSEKILEMISRALKVPFAAFYNDVGMKIISKYGSLHACFQLLNNEPGLITELGIDKKIADSISDLVTQRFKPPEVKLSKTLSIKCMSSNGIEVIKRALKKAVIIAEAKKYDFKISYLGAPSYRMTITASDYKSANSIMDELVSTVVNDVKSHEGEADIVK